jgi:hypothetical protein
MNKLDPDEILIFEIYLQETVKYHTRESYGVFHLLGEVGGVMDIIISVIGIFITPYAVWAFKLKYLSKLFSIRGKNDEFSKEE